MSGTEENHKNSCHKKRETENLDLGQHSQHTLRAVDLVDMGVLGGPIVDMGVRGGAMADTGVLTGLLIDGGVLVAGALLRLDIGVLLRRQLLVLACRTGVDAQVEGVTGEVKTECILERLCRRVAERVVSFNYNMHR